MRRTAILCPAGIRPEAVTPSSEIRAPEISWWRAMTTSSAGCSRMVAVTASLAVVSLLVAVVVVALLDSMARFSVSVGCRAIRCGALCCGSLSCPYPT
jgi:hypothetical protein